MNFYPKASLKSVHKWLFIVLLGGLFLLPKMACAEASASDSRTAIWLNDAERSAILAEMRQFLSASQSILQATLNDDMEQVEQTARAVGLKQARGVPKTLQEKLPQGFTQLGPQVHIGFEEIADEAATMGDTQVILQRLAEVQKLCIQCHAIYRLERR